MFHFCSPWEQKNKGLRSEKVTEFESCSPVSAIDTRVFLNCNSVNIELPDYFK